MRRIRTQLQHWLNPLHVFCRLREAGLRASVARRLAAQYERFLYRPVLG